MARNSYFQQAFAVQTLGGAAGRTFTIGNTGWAALNCVRVQLVTTATAGNRLLKLRVIDNGGVNVLYEYIDANPVAASLTAAVQWASGVAQAVSGVTHVLPLPSELPVPLAFQLNVFDSANIDVNDTIQPIAVMTLY